MTLSFPHQLDRIRDGILAQRETLEAVANIFADVLAGGGLVHIYANGHSRIAVEELCVRMGALTGFRAILSQALANFTDVIGPDGLRLNQAIEKIEGLGAKLLDECDFGRDEPLIVVSATGQTQAAVDIALEFQRRYPDNPLIAIVSLEQSRSSPPKHSSGMTLYHIIRNAKQGFLLDNCMPVGDVSVHVEGATGNYAICPLSSIGALSIIHSLNELTVRAMDARGHRHHVLQNMHLGETQVNYDEWLRDQRARYSRALSNPNAVTPAV